VTPISWLRKLKKKIKQRQIYLEYFIAAQVGLKGNETILNLNVAGRQMGETWRQMEEIKTQ
jgi:hypothetical protein